VNEVDALTWTLAVAAPVGGGNGIGTEKSCASSGVPEKLPGGTTTPWPARDHVTLMRAGEVTSVELPESIDMTNVNVLSPVGVGVGVGVGTGSFGIVTKTKAGELGPEPQAF